MSKRIPITLLSSLVGSDFPAALQRQAALGLKYLDLKDGIFGQSIEKISEETAERAAALCKEVGLAVDCFSTSIGRTKLAGLDEVAFRAQFEPVLENALCAARIMQPRTFRLLVPEVEPEPNGSRMGTVLEHAPWLISVYQDWVERIHATGMTPLIENEAFGCLFATPQDVTTFFKALDRPFVRYIWDIQNMWQMGNFPSLEIYHEVRPLLGAIHLKGGRSDVPGGPITTGSSLENASWPVLDIVRAAIADDAIAVICLNPSHGAKPADWDLWEITKQDLNFLRREIPEIL